MNEIKVVYVIKHGCFKNSAKARFKDLCVFLQALVIYVYYQIRLCGFIFLKAKCTLYNNY